MTVAKGRKIRTGRRGFVAMTLAILAARVPAGGTEQPKVPKSGAKTSPQRARLPRRLAADFHSHIETRLPHLRAPFESAALETGFGWRMLAALGYQESRWRPAAVSPRGAQGVMMLMPVTAKKMGVNNVFSPDENILAGARYLLLMKDRIPHRIRDPDRTWLAMAAYNIGIGHLEVRANLPRLSDPRWHSRVKRGYANGRETVEFVERVAQFAAILESTVPESELARTTPGKR
jgi:membrane-bound lytic murein transglycosylase F